MKPASDRRSERASAPRARSRGRGARRAPIAGGAAGAANLPKSALVLAVEAALQRAGTPKRRAIAPSYFPTSMRVFGVSVPALRKLAHGLARELHDEPRRVLALAHELVGSGSLEARQVAYELLAVDRDAAALLTTKTVEELGQGIDNWGSVDAFGVLVAGRAWNAGRVSDAAVRRWACSKDRWWRRLALVATVALNARSHGGTGDVPKTLAVCARLAADKDDMVAKALSWALREASKRDPGAVRSFLREHERALAARVLREVENKLATGRKSGAKANARRAALVLQRGSSGRQRAFRPLARARPASDAKRTRRRSTVEESARLSR